MALPCDGVSTRIRLVPRLFNTRAWAFLVNSVVTATVWLVIRLPSSVLVTNSTSALLHQERIDLRLIPIQNFLENQGDCGGHR